MEGLITLTSVNQDKVRHNLRLQQVNPLQQRKLQLQTTSFEAPSVLQRQLYKHQ